MKTEQTVLEVDPSPIKFINPSRIVPVTWDEFLDSFPGVVKEIESGTIFHVRGHPAIEEFYRKFVEPPLVNRNYEFFHENPKEIHNGQFLQKALFTDLAKEHDFFIDSYIRLRRVVNGGSFVGPHIDFYEALLLNGINFWVSFSALERTESLQFLPAAYHPHADNAGAFKPGMRSNWKGQLRPVDRLKRDALSTSIKPCEFLVFNSGCTVHCSPWNNPGQRVSVDQRLFIPVNLEASNFGTIGMYYHGKDLNAFSHDRSAAEVLTELWRGYVRDFDSFYARLLAHPFREGEEISRDVLKGVNPHLVFSVASQQRMASVPRDYVLEALVREPQSVGLRLKAFNVLKKIEINRRKIFLELLDLCPETANKTYGILMKELTVREAVPLFVDRVRKWGVIRSFAIFLLLQVMHICRNMSRSRKSNIIWLQNVASRSAELVRWLIHPEVYRHGN